MARIARVFLALVVVCVVAVAAAVLGGRYYLGRWMATPGPLAAPVTVVIPRGTGIDGIAVRLADAGAIDRLLLLRIAARIGDDAKGLQAGEYALKPGMSPAEILAKLRSGDVVLHPVTVPEGLTVAEAMAIIGNSPVLSGELPPVPGLWPMMRCTVLRCRKRQSKKRSSTSTSFSAISYSFHQRSVFS